MSATNFTPIQLYRSTTAAAVPLAANLSAGELAINIVDGKLYYNDSGTVKLLASAAGASGDVVGPASATDNALARFDLATGKLIQSSVGILSDAGVLTGLTGLTSSGSITLSSLTSGRVTYAGTAGLLQDSANLTFNGTTLTANTIGAFTLAGTVAGGGNQLNNVVIGTTTPLAGNFTTLSATGVATFSAGTAALPAITTSGDTNTGIFFPAADTIAFSEGGAEAMRINSSGQLDLVNNPILTGGTANGVAYLNGSKVLTTSSALTFDGSTFSNVQGSGTAALEFNTLSFSRNGANYITATLSTLNYGASQHIFGNNTLASEWMRLTNAGNVGIGTSSPAARLHVFQSGGSDMLRVGDGTSNFYFSPNGSGDGVIKLDTANPIRFLNAGGERMRIDSSGNLLVGCTTTPAGNRTMGFAAKSNSTGGIQVYQSTSNSDWAVNATSGAIVNFYSDNGSALVYAGSINVSGNVTSYSSVSDYRLKENVQPMAGALANVLSLKPVTFSFKEGGQASQGFIAHELQSVIPDAVTGEKDALKEDGSPEYQGVDTSFLVATLTAAIQEQQALITSLTTRLTALESI
jgi:hypothetical protein